MDNRPIGVFDSGVGGLTTVKELHRILPAEDIIYFGDTGRVPYGPRSRQTIRKYAAQDIRYLMTYDVKAIVAACGTVSANFTEKDVEEMGISVPYTGVVLPATRSACAASSGGRIGVIATPAAVHSGAYGKALRSIQPGAQVFGNAAPLLVPLVENGMTEPGNPVTRMVLEMYLEPLIRENIDTLILGCTHYPLLYDTINEILEYRVTLIDSGAAAARELQVMLVENDLQADRETGSTQYRVTDSVENFMGVASNFLMEDLGGNIEFVDLDAVSAFNG